MAPKKNTAASTTAAAATSTEKQTVTPTAPSAAAKRSPTTKSGATSWDVVFQNIYTHYLKETTQRTKLIDVFLAFLVVVGALQFAYCVLAGNYPFNAFLSGFSATVGQFVLAISLRIQTATTDKNEFPSVSPERAFADFIVCSLILHFFCINFIN
ncbi:Defender against death DAD protein [Cordyceps fumosorosea ARSEF 2679]|uniref:Dolichyl-diphosphooligosaccharide--protein glycosyltransferase subunit OST2 n=1 Tax=Cordyceps fumosorosea (strain ARSEF 2679) TaxID=1081104 RepID=A0A167XCN6_CORFA|nr:Defender against death DAD protein [Cordyceps fumosorosea ARSEF 2679]OAA64809.1 Defender against death DAD protein [Cordyceps fumosorosea ARSEF 2679]